MEQLINRPLTFDYFHKTLLYDVLRILYPIFIQYLASITTPNKLIVETRLREQLHKVFLELNTIKDINVYIYI